jgi:glycosyltransferase involved in cell wall biosynthesis
MKILYDYQIFHYQKYGGISRYFSKLLNTFLQHHMVDIQLLLNWSTNDEIDRLQPILGKVKKNLPISERFLLPGSGKLQRFYYYLFPSRNRELVQQQAVIQALKNKQTDIFHPTYFEDYYLPYASDVPLVVTVFDMIYELLPEYYPTNRDETIRRKKKSVIMKAKKIIAISESSKNDLCRLYGINREKVVVVPLASSITFEQSSSLSQTTGWIPEKYLLYVGTRTGYKNYRLFLSSIVDLFEKYQDLFLVCTGAPFTKDELSLHSSTGMRNRVLYQEAHSDSTLSALYSNALALVFPSLYEGFGLPILEAMHCGCPVVVSNTSSCPEVAGNAALYVDPRSADSIHSSVSRILESSALRAELREKGREREKIFSWKNTAEQTFEVYKSVL